MAKNICQICQKEMRNKQLLENHLRVTHKVYYQCPRCPKQITYLNNFAKHYLDARHGILEEAKSIEKTLNPQYLMDSADFEESMYTYKPIHTLCVCACWLQISRLQKYSTVKYSLYSSIRCCFNRSDRNPK